MSQGVRPPEAQIRQRINMNKTFLRKFIEKSAARREEYLTLIAELEAEHKALLAEGSK